MTTAKRKPNRTKGFPIFPHASGQWAKKIKGKTVYFGVWSDPKAALQRYHAHELGHTNCPQVHTVRFLLNAWLTSREDKKNRGELTVKTFFDYLNFARAISGVIGDVPANVTGPTHFSLVSSMMTQRAWQATTRRKVMSILRTAILWSRNQGLIEKVPQFGPDFMVPVRAIRQQRFDAGAKFYCPYCIETLVNTAPIDMRAMILLAISGGMGTADISGLIWNRIDFATDLIHHPRPKTLVDRTIPMWPEVRSLLSAIPRRGDRIFTTKYGNPWFNPESKCPDALGKQFAKLCKRAGVKCKGFYTMRRTWRTVADETGDSAAVDRIMGHATPGMGARYVQHIAPERLWRVSNYVRAWLLHPAVAMTVSAVGDQVQDQPEADD